MIEFMIDIETLGTEPGSVITQIGVSSFELDGDGTTGTALCHIDIEDSISRGLKINWDTISWWARQNETARARIFRKQPDAIKLETALERLRARVKGRGGLWANGPVFDMVLLEAAYRAIGAKIPWQFWRFRDQRTIISLSGLDKKTVPQPEGFVEHQADWDCHWQILQVQAAYRKLMG